MNMLCQLKKSQIQDLRIVLGFAILLFGYAPVFSQDYPIKFSYTAHRVILKELNLKDENGLRTSVSQFAFPQSFSIHFGQHGTLGITSIYAFSQFRIDKEEKQKFKFINWSDIKITGSYLITRSWLMTFGLNLPTGDERLNQNEFVVANVIAEDALDLPITLYGTGFEGNFGLFRAFSVGNFTLGAGMSYFARGGYQFLEENEDSKLQPGDELTAILGINRILRDGKLALHLYATHRRFDIFEGKKVYDAGEKIVAKVSGSYQRYPWSFRLEAVNRVRFGAGFVNSPDTLNLIRDDLNENPYQLEMLLNVQQVCRELPMQISYLADFKLFTENDAGSEDALLFGAGAGLQFFPAKWIRLGIEAVYHTGDFTSRGKKINISGFQMSGMIKFVK